MNAFQTFLHVPQPFFFFIVNKLEVFHHSMFTAAHVEPILGEVIFCIVIPPHEG